MCVDVCVCMGWACNSLRRVACIKIRTTYAGNCPSSINHGLDLPDIAIHCGRAGNGSWRALCVNECNVWYDIQMSHVCTCVCVCMDCACNSHRRVTCIKIRTTYAGKCPTSIKHRVVRADIETNCGRAGFPGWCVLLVYTPKTTRRDRL